MVISFSNDTAFEQLRDEGFVVTFRPDERKGTPKDGVQQTWCNRGRGEEKVFDVHVRHLAYMWPDDELFGEFYPMSGFRRRQDWLVAVLDLHDEVPATGHFYLVTRPDNRSRNL